MWRRPRSAVFIAVWVGPGRFCGGMHGFLNIGGFSSAVMSPVYCFYSGVGGWGYRGEGVHGLKV